MTQPTFFSTDPVGGIDFNNVYAVSASLTPETPAPPFLVGTEMMGSNGAQFIFVQASTSVSANDFVVISGTHQANSMTSVNLVASSVGVRIGVAPGAPVVTSLGIAAASYFWACLNGSQVPGNGLGQAAGAASDIQLWSSLTAGAVASISSTSSIALGGVMLTASVTVNPATFTLSWPRVWAVSGISTPAIGAP